MAHDYTGMNRELCHSKVWSGMPGETRGMQIANAVLGVYKSLQDTPEKYRLKQFVSEYEGRPIMDEYLDSHKPDISERTRNDRYHRTRRRVEDVVDRHYAFLTPTQADAVFETIRDNDIYSQYTAYLNSLRGMYEWLVWRSDYPHRYNPIDMAIRQQGAVHDILEDWLDHANISEYDYE